MGEIHQDVIEAHYQLMDAYVRLQYDKKVLEHLLKILELNESLHGETSEPAGYSYLEIARMCRNRKEYQRAIQYYSRALATYKVLLRENPMTPDYMIFKLEAEAHLKECQKEMESSMKPNDTT